MTVVSLFEKQVQKLADSLEARLLMAEVFYALGKYADFFERNGVKVFIRWPGREAEPLESPDNVVRHFDWGGALQEDGSGDAA